MKVISRDLNMAVNTHMPNIVQYLIRILGLILLIFSCTLQTQDFGNWSISATRCKEEFDPTQLNPIETVTSGSLNIFLLMDPVE
jgi:hypothetical protein